jgi:hypothetical protein
LVFSHQPVIHAHELVRKNFLALRLFHFKIIRISSSISIATGVNNFYFVHARLACLCLAGKFFCLAGRKIDYRTVIAIHRAAIVFIFRAHVSIKLDIAATPANILHSNFCTDRLSQENIARRIHRNLNIASLATIFAFYLFAFGLPAFASVARSWQALVILAAVVAILHAPPFLVAVRVLVLPFQVVAVASVVVSPSVRASAAVVRKNRNRQG